VCISWKLKCWILLTHGVTMKFKGQSLPTALGTRWREYIERNSDGNTAKHALNYRTGLHERITESSKGRRWVCEYRTDHHYRPSS